MKAVADNDQDFAEASYKNSDGVVVTTGWSDLDADAVAAGAPWRKFAWYLGQQSFRVFIGALPRVPWWVTNPVWSFLTW